MKILIIGGGGREHALAYFLNKSAYVDRIFCIPGNAGTQEIVENVDLESNYNIMQFAKKEKIGLTIIGPEHYLVNGIVDMFKKEQLSIFGPTLAGARIEGNKLYAKGLMKEAGISTAKYQSLHTIQQFPCVMKLNEPAGGKGVYIVNSLYEAKKVRNIFKEKPFLIEEYLKGKEISLLAFCDGETILPLIPAQDYKQLYENDKGPNTGGMGAIAPVPSIDQKMIDKIMDKVFFPLLGELKKREIDYRGIIYAGLMICNDEPYVLEFNCRFGDPETQVILPLLKTDLFELMYACVYKELKSYNLKWKDKYACGVVLASYGYPNKYTIGRRITGLEKFDKIKNTFVFHSGTKSKPEYYYQSKQQQEICIKKDILTDGGRVLTIVSVKNTLEIAIKNVYNLLDLIKFKGRIFRKDIGFRENEIT